MKYPYRKAPKYPVHYIGKMPLCIWLSRSWCSYIVYKVYLPGGGTSDVNGQGREARGFKLIPILKPEKYKIGTHCETTLMKCIPIVKLP